MDREAIDKELRRHKPMQILVHQADGEDRLIALRGRRTKWEHAAATLTPMLREIGAYAELRDGDGAVIAMIEGPKPAGAASSAAIAGVSPEVSALVAVTDHLLDRWQKQTDSVLSAAIRTIEALGKRAESSERTIERLLRTTYETTVSASQAVSEATMALASREAEIAGESSPLDGALKTFSEAAANRLLGNGAKPKELPKE